MVFEMGGYVGLKIDGVQWKMVDKVWRNLVNGNFGEWKFFQLTIKKIKLFWKISLKNCEIVNGGRYDASPSGRVLESIVGSAGLDCGLGAQYWRIFLIFLIFRFFHQYRHKFLHFSIFS